MRRRRRQKSHLGFVIIVVLLAFGAWGYSFYKEAKYSVPEAPESSTLSDVMQLANHMSLAEHETLPAEVPAEELPKALNIEMPFYSQAPHGNWDLPYQEACEEASVLLAVNVLQGKEWSKDEFNEEILKLVEWQKETFGDYLHTTVEQTAQMAREVFKVETKIHENPSFEDIQRIIARGNLIVAPFAGKHLGNPFYSNGGPRYHMMVIKGYDVEKQHIVTHDVGTRRGEDYVYRWEVIEKTLRDWTDGDILTGTPRLIEISL